MNKIASNINDKGGVRKVHMIGINGISMSGLSELLIHMGYSVSGSDVSRSERTEHLEKMGAVIYDGNEPENIKDPDLIVYTSAVKRGNPELERALESGVPCMDRAELLGLVMSKYDKSVAVSGTHGKTTTTSMITEIMIRAGFDPTAHIGAEYEPIGGTTRIGGNEFFVAEACEYCESFLKLQPSIALIMNVELDHIDYYRDLEHFKEAFKSFSLLVPGSGHVVANGDDRNCLDIYESLPLEEREKWLFFGLEEESRKSCDVFADNIEFNTEYCGVFDVRFRRDPDLSLRVRLKVPGVHNVYNALAAAAVCHTAGCTADSIRSGLFEFGGAKKRFEFKGTVQGMTIIDDYAHHPSEIRRALHTGKNQLELPDPATAIGKASKSRLICVFQSHTYSRTEYFLDEFADALTGADLVLLPDIYAAREPAPGPGGISSAMLAESINKKGGQAIYIGEGFEKIADYILDNGKPGDIVITMGAGEAVQTADALLRHV